MSFTNSSRNIRFASYNINTANVEYPVTPQAGQVPNNEFAIQQATPALSTNLINYGFGAPRSFNPSNFPNYTTITGSIPAAPHSSRQQVVQQAAATQAGVSNNALAANTSFVQPIWEWPIGFNSLQGINSALPVNGTSTTFIQYPDSALEAGAYTVSYVSV